MSDNEVRDGTTKCPECGNPVFFRITKPAPNAAKVVYFGSPLNEVVDAAREVINAKNPIDWRRLGDALQQTSGTLR